MKATTLKILGHDFIGAKDGYTYYLATPEIEKALEYRADSGRKILSSKSLKTFAGNDFQVGKKKIKYLNQNYSAITTDTFITLIKWEAKVKKNDKAIDFLTAMAEESTQDLKS
jgi:hypothetical protein